MFRSAIVLTGLLLFVISAASTSFAADTKQVYDFYCAQCHGLTGKGDGANVTDDMATTPRDFSNKADMNKLTDKDVRSAIADGGPAVGKSAVMPPWSKTLTDSEIDGLVKHIRKLCKCKGK